MRNTKQKKLIYEIVDNSHNHMTANEVYEKARESINNISLGTVYRILNVLSNNHQIRRITTKSGVDHFDSITNENHQPLFWPDGMFQWNRLEMNRFRCIGSFLQFTWR